MNKYSLAKLMEWAGPEGVAGRKRLQKVVFFLQKAGCPFDAEYTLHHYGPYSRDVAEACDELVNAGLVVESQAQTLKGAQYIYLLAESGTVAIAQTEKRMTGQTSALAAHQALAGELLRKDLWELELGSTILYFQSKWADWDEALQKACDFKKIDKHVDSTVPAATELAKRVYARAAGAIN